MEKRIIKAIIAERQREISNIQLVKRPIYFEEQANYVLVGIRRAGKSYQMYQDIQNLIESGKATIEDCLYINFEDERISSISSSELGLLLECYAEMYDNRTPLIYLDEIQNIAEWEKAVNSLSQDYTEDCEIVITGSNSKMLSSQLSTLLSGRYIEFKVFPFNIEEYALISERNVNKDTYMEFLKSGGFPELFHLNNFETKRNLFLLSKIPSC